MVSPIEVQELHTTLRGFENQFQYDASYLHDILDCHPEAYLVFLQAQKMGNFRQELPIEVYFVATITTMQTEDCSGCLQLNYRMAQASGVDQELLDSLENNPNSLPEILSDVRLHVKDVLENQSPCPERADRIREQLGKPAFAELALCIAGARVYPTLKKSLLYAGSCTI